MTTKPLLLAIMFILPFGARAELQIVRSPEHVPENGKEVRSGYSAPYQIATINDGDDEHIATTAYVKGAYNDTIAAVNRIGLEVSNKQIQITDMASGDDMLDEVFSAEDFVQHMANGDEDLTLYLASAADVVAGIQSQRVEIYTTWDDDDATTDVAFKTVVPED